jgi:hypothetical protein
MCEYGIVKVDDNLQGKKMWYCDLWHFVDVHCKLKTPRMAMP